MPPMICYVAVIYEFRSSAECSHQGFFLVIFLIYFNVRGHSVMFLVLFLPTHAYDTDTRTAQTPFRFLTTQL